MKPMNENNQTPKPERKARPVKPRRVVQLSERDGDVLDAILEARSQGLDRGPLPPDSQERAERVQQVLGLLDQMPAEDPVEDLAARTLQRVNDARQRQRFAIQAAMLAEPRPTFGVAWRQVLTGAAIVLVGLSLLLPSLEHGRQNSARVVCSSLLGQTGQAIGMYAQDNKNTMPRRSFEAGGIWWGVGQSFPDRSASTIHSNFDNLKVLLDAGYAGVDQLYCPEQLRTIESRHKSSHQLGVPVRETAYDYQNQFTSGPIRIDANNNLAILADKNPLFIVRADEITFRLDVSPDSNSRVHPSGGQNVLIADGSVTWTLRPTLRRPGTSQRDNIWVRDTIGYEIPNQTSSWQEDGDSHLVP